MGEGEGAVDGVEFLLIGDFLLARLFSKKALRYCHSPGMVVGSGGFVRKL